MIKRLRILTVLVLFPIFLVAQNQVTVNSNITTDTYWTPDNEYILDGAIFVTNGASLFIEAGTVIKAEDGVNLDASALIITRDAKIFAEGTANNPIIFTSINDDGTLTKDNVGEWGGVIILGNATTNNPTTEAIEGVNEIESDLTLVGYGGNDDMDDSGVLRYVSIRYSGINVGQSSDNEIQGLTLGGVGAGTTIEYVESFASGDDGFEFFGGTVNTKYLISAFNNDDAFDWDEGFRGKGQFWFAIQDTDNAGRVAEMDGSSVSSEDTNPYAFPVISNATYIGPGSSNIPAGDGSGEFMLFRDNTGGEYHNSIFTAHSAIAVEVEEKGTEVDSESRLAADSLNIKNSIFFDFGAGADFASISSAAFVATELGLTANVNAISDPFIRSIDRTASTFGLDPRFNEGSPAASGAVIPDDEFFTEVSYKGAFGVKNWMVGWTGLDALGFINQGIVTNNEEEVTTVPSSVILKQNYPNPFNPSTQISFQLPSAQKVTLKVYDMLGREVATLLNNEQYGSGSSSVTFDATNLSSGIYLYRLTGSDFTKTQRMTLIK